MSTTDDTRQRSDWPTELPNPAYDADLLRRAATACRNLQRRQCLTGTVDWFDWVPQHLDQLADRLDATAVRAVAEATDG